jgi:NAD-dependent DNA ligase
VTVTHATAFNAKFIVDNTIGVGAVIQIIRSGDVIPHIMKVIKPSSNGKPLLPTVSYEWSDTDVDIILSDETSNAYGTVLARKVVHFFKTLNIKNIDEGIIKKMVDAGYDTILKILSSNPNELIKIDGIGTKLVDKINKNIADGLSQTDLATFMAASHKFGRGIAIKKLKLLLKTYPNILKQQKNWDHDTFIDNIIIHKGIEIKTAQKIVNNFDDFMNFMNDVNLIYDISHLCKHKNTKNKSKNHKIKFLVDKKIAITGFTPKKELKEYIEENGGSVSTTVSKNTSLVVYEPNDKKQSSKMTKAKELMINVMTKKIFFETISWTE